MDPNFRFIKLVDLSKSTSKIKECFAKLTLSSRKKTDPKTKPDPGEGPAPRTSSTASRKLFNDILTDDESDTELAELNRIFCTQTTARTEANGAGAPRISPRRKSTSFSQKLQVSDSDETNCSIEFDAIVEEMQSEMESLEISSTQTQTHKSSEKLFSESSPTTDQQIPMQQLSTILSSLDIKGETETTEKPSSGARAADAQLESIFTKQLQNKAGNEPRKSSILTISSTRTTPVSTNGDSDSDVIIISESESEEDYSYPVSSIRRSDKTESNTISGYMADRLNAFFNNIPPLDSSQGPETLMSAVVPKREVERVPRSSSSIEIEDDLHDDSIEVCETSDESLPNTLAKPQSSPQKYPPPTQSPKSTSFTEKSQTTNKSPTPLKTATPKICENLYKSTPPAATRVTTRKDTTPSPSPKNTVSLKKSHTSKQPRTPRKTRTPKVVETLEKSPTPRTRATTRKDISFSSPKESTINSQPSKEPPTPRKTTTPKIGKTMQKSPTPPTQKYPSPSPSPPRRESESDYISDCRIEKINISATFKIKLQISDAGIASMQSTPIIYSPSPNARRITQSTESPPKESEKVARTPDNQKSIRVLQTPHIIDLDTIATPPPIIDLTSAATPQPPIIDLAAIATPQPPIVDLIAFETPQPLTEPTIDLDDAAHKLLNELYGDEWKTPEVVKTLKKGNASKAALQKTVDESVMDFSKFHNSIASDFESTRLPGMTKSTVKKEPIFKIPFTERRVVRMKTDEPTKHRTQIKTKTSRNRTVRIQNLNESDSTDSNDNFNASSDDSWRDVFSCGSDDEQPRSNKKTPKKAKKKNSSQDDLIYLDLSSDVVKVQDDVNDSPTANNDQDFLERIGKILDTYKVPDKPKIEATPINSKTKRKLFTANFGNEDEVGSPVKSSETVFRYTDNDSVTLRTPLPAMYDPINKQLESVKTGKPIFAIKTPSTVSKKNKENALLTNVESPSATPKRTKGTSKKSDSASNINLQSTPTNKYGFLQSLDVMVSKMFCHPDALIYRDNYKSKKQELAEKLYEIFNQKVFNGDLDTPLFWNKKLLNTAGRCSCSTKSGKRFCRIELSEKVLTSADRLRCTLIHELCHAATWIYSGEHGHGASWKKWARRANGIFPELPKIGVCHDYDIDYKYTYKCTLCGAKSHAHSKSKKVENIRCYYCHGAIEIFLNKKDKDGNVMPTPVKEPTGFAKFVKDNYKKHKQPDLKHAEVMKILSKEFASVNVNAKK